LPIEDSYFELLADTLESLDLPARGQFLQRYFRAIAHIDLDDTRSLQIWDEMLSRRRELTALVGRPVALKTALVDVLTSSGLLRVPILIEYEELKRLELNAVTDPLTGLHNRRLFAETFEKELNRARRYVQPLGLVTLDLHRFKEVNDKHGHPRGDDVLRAAAATLKKALRTSDSAFRIGGDEFALLLPQTDSPQALALCRRVQTVFAEMLQQLQLTVTVAMDHGVAIFPQDAEQADQLIRIADERLYQLKHANHSRSGNGSARTEAPPAPTPEEPPPPAPERAAHAPQPISIETRRMPEKIETAIEAAPSADSAAPPAELVSAPPRVFAIQRKAERVSMTGTNAYAVLGDQGGRRARVLDLGFGGVAIELDSPEDLPENLLAVLHVPILPPVRVNLKPVWKQQTGQGSLRVGCSFVS
jgi:diguanylate cyclase (GGDEF)-like protein